MPEISSANLLTAVIVLCMASTFALLYYARVSLPRKIERRMRQSVSAFATAVELRIPSHKGLSERVAILSQAVAKQMGLSLQARKNLELASQLRDIGLVAVPYELLNHKSAFAWDDADWDTYFRHPEVGGAMLELVPWLRHLAPIVRLHHRPYAGDQDVFPGRTDIPIESRVLKAVSDYVWNSKHQGALLARDTLKRGKGSEYDPAVAEALLAVLTSKSGEPASPSYAQV